jgi:hypothetical protein
MYINTDNIIKTAIVFSNILFVAPHKTKQEIIQRNRGIHAVAMDFFNSFHINTIKTPTIRKVRTEYIFST